MLKRKKRIERRERTPEEKCYVNLGCLITNVKHKELQEKNKTDPVDIDFEVLELLVL